VPGVAAIVYDRDQVKKSEFVPSVVAGTIASLEHVPKGELAQQKSTQTAFEVKQGKLLQLAKRLDTSVSQGQTLAVRGAGYELRGTIANFKSRPLAEFDSEESVNQFVDELIQMAESSGN